MKNKDFNIYELVTKQILQNMMNGELPWRQTWKKVNGRKLRFSNRFTGNEYSFFNSLLLGKPGEYIAMSQIKTLGGRLKKGAKSRIIISYGDYIPAKYKELEKELLEKGESTEHLKEKYMYYRRVFHLDDVEGIAPSEQPTETAPVEAEDPTDITEMVIHDYTVSNGIPVEKTPACENPHWDCVRDSVEVPQKKQFTFEEDFYATLLSCLVHSTATDGRCDRSAELKKMMEGGMSVKEELIAEMASSMILASAGMNRRETHEQIAAECQKWVREFNNDYSLIIQASYGAEKAAKLIMGKFAA